MVRIAFDRDFDQTEEKGKLRPEPEVLMVFGEAPMDPIGRLETIYLPGAGFAGWGLRLRVIHSNGLTKR